MTVRTIGIVGLGLIGGSIALRAKAADPGIQVIGMSRSSATVAEAISMGIIDRAAASFFYFEGADIVFVCTPIPIVLETLIGLDQALVTPTILTDVASLKGALAEAVAQRQWRHPVVLGHPMAGKETSGLASADAELLVGKTYIVIDDTTVLTEVLTEWGCRVLGMTATEHDRLVGYASHLPYLASVLGAAMAMDSVADIPLFSKIVASGFKDTTRVSASDPEWGADVLMGNRETVFAGIESAKILLAEIEDTIRTDDRTRLRAILSEIKAFRAGLYSPK
jgi:arogenate dehydrogenase (NADP+)